MSKTRSRDEIVHRRGELLAELFLEELEPEFLARPSTDLGYDYLVGFRNPRGGINNVAVQVKATERLARRQYVISRKAYHHLANSNIPVLLLVVDAKENRLYFALPTPEAATEAADSRAFRVELTEITDQTKAELADRLRG